MNTWVRELLRRPAGRFGTVVVGAVFGAALLSLFWTPHDLLQQDIAERWRGPGQQHWLGTDQIGRDTLSWLLAGSRTTVLVATWATLIAAAVGIALAALTALSPRWLAEPVIVVVDILIAFPVLLIAMLLAAAFGGSLSVVVTAVGVGVGVNIARVVRPEIRRVLASDYVLAARAGGVGPGGVLARHVIPGAGPVVIVQLSYVAAIAILAEASLSYLGYGAPPARRPGGAACRSRSSTSRCSRRRCCGPASRSPSPFWPSRCSATRCARPSTRACAAGRQFGRQRRRRPREPGDRRPADLDPGQDRRRRGQPGARRRRPARAHRRVGLGQVADRPGRAGAAPRRQHRHRQHPPRRP
ncbi:ABC transporter permease [Dactylosporangium cerinum]